MFPRQYSFLAVALAYTHTHTRTYTGGRRSCHTTDNGIPVEHEVPAIFHMISYRLIDFLYTRRTYEGVNDLRGALRDRRLSANRLKNQRFRSTVETAAINLAWKYSNIKRWHGKYFFNFLIFIHIFLRKKKRITAWWSDNLNILSSQRIGKGTSTGKSLHRYRSLSH